MIKLLPRDGDLQLAPQQESWWYNEFLVGHIYPNNIHKTLYISAPFSPVAFEQSIATLQRRHEALRTAFLPRESGGGKVVIIPPDKSELPVSLIDFSHLDSDKQTHAIHCLSEQELNRPFDLVRGCLFHVIIARLGKEDHVILFTIHHLVYDRWSGDVLLTEVTELYESAVSGKQSQLPLLEFQYVDFAQWQRDWLSSTAAVNQFFFWRCQLAPPLEPLLPALNGDQELNSAPLVIRGCVPFIIDAQATEAARIITRREKCTLFSTIVTIMNIALYAYTQQQDLRIGTPTTNRFAPGTERIVGLFLNIICLRTKIEPERLFREYLHLVFATIIDAMDNQDIPYEIMVQDLEATHQISHEALLHAVVHWMTLSPHVASKFPNTTDEKISIDEIDTRESVVFARNNINFRFELTERESIITGKITYNLSHFTVPEIRDLANALKQCLILSAMDSEVTISQLYNHIVACRKAQPSSLPLHYSGQY